MPNRKVNTGWYKLPRSGTPYYGPIPEGAETLKDTEVKKLVDSEGVLKNSGKPAATEAEAPGGAQG